MLWSMWRSLCGSRLLDNYPSLMSLGMTLDLINQTSHQLFRSSYTLFLAFDTSVCHGIRILIQSRPIISTWEDFRCSSKTTMMTSHQRGMTRIKNNWCFLFRHTSSYDVIGVLQVKAPLDAIMKNSSGNASAQLFSSVTSSFDTILDKWLATCFSQPFWSFTLKSNSCNNKTHQIQVP